MIRNQTIDQARFLAAAGVVWIHSLQSDSLQPWKELGRFAVPFFVILTVLLTMQGVDRVPGRPLKEFASQRFQRLYLPMLIWSVVYLLLKLAKLALQPNSPNEFPGLSFLWGGSAYHLWFIPFMFAVCMLTFAVRKMCLHKGRFIQSLPWLLTATACGIAFATPELSIVQWDPGLEWMWRATPAALLGIALFSFSGTGSEGLHISPKIYALAVIVGFVSMLLSIYQPDQIALQTVAGLMFLITVLNAPPLSEKLGWLTHLGRISMGIYFSHLLLVKVGEIFLDRVKLVHPETRDIVLFTSALLGSIAISSLLYRSERTRWLVA